MSLYYYCCSSARLPSVHFMLMYVQGHEDSIHAAVVSPDERLLATASFDSTVRIWDFTTGECLRVLQHTDPVQLVAFAPPPHRQGTSYGSAADAGSSKQQGRSTRLVTGCDGRALWLWDVQTGACVAALGEHKEAVAAVCFSPDGQWLASASQDRSVLVWQADTGRLAGLYVGDAAMVSCCFGIRGQSPRAAGADGTMHLQRHDKEKDGSTAGSASAFEMAQPGGLTLLVGSASGRVHFVDCL